MRFSVEEKYPFAAQILIHFLLLTMSTVFFEGYYAITFLFFFLGVLLFRLNAWALSSGFLLSLSADFYIKGNLASFWVTVSFLGLGIGIEIIKVALPEATKQRLNIRPGPSIWQNAIFAIVGAAIPIAIMTFSCPPVLGGEYEGALASRSVYAVYYCQERIAFEATGAPFNNDVEAFSSWYDSIITDIPAVLKIFGIAMGLLPAVWMAFFAALRQEGILHPIRLFLKFLLALLFLRIVSNNISSLLVKVAAGILGQQTVIDLGQQLSSFGEFFIVSSVAFRLIVDALAAGWVVSLRIKKLKN